MANRPVDAAREHVAVRSAVWVAARPGVALALLAAVLTGGCDVDSEKARERLTRLDVAAASYGPAAAEPCVPPQREGGAGRTDGLRTPAGIAYSVRAPSNYDPARRHALLVVYAPASTDAATSESVVGLTHSATAAGFVVAYADHVALGPRGAKALAHVPEDVARRWCIDPKRVFLSGHSDGGTVSHIVALMNESRGTIAGIAPSAAGVVATDLAAYGCRSPIPVMIMHNLNDRLFPDFGAQAARWWAACNGCDAAEAEVRADGCKRYRNCRAPTLYCESPGSHSRWPDRADAIVKFLSGEERP